MDVEPVRFPESSVEPIDAGLVFEMFPCVGCGQPTPFDDGCVTCTEAGRA